MASAWPTFPSAMETNNYACLCRLLVEVGWQALRDTFDEIHPPTDLHDVLMRPPARPILQSLKQERVLSTAQWGKLYPIIPWSLSSGSFDMLLLILLLKNICGLNPPFTGWDSLPPAEDRGIAANISRVIYYRNKIYELHASQGFVDDTTFNTMWRDISNALVGLGARARYWNAINRLKTESMDPEFFEHYQDLLKQWKRDDDNIKDKHGEMQRIIEIKRKKPSESNEDEFGEMEGTLLQMKPKKIKEAPKDGFEEKEGIDTEQDKQRKSIQCSDKPPRLSIQPPKQSGLPNISSPWSHDQLPIDVLLLTVEDHELLSVFSYLVNPFRSYCEEIGFVYFGTVNGGHQEKLKIALIKCSKGSSAPGGSLTVVKNAFWALQPKAVFSVGSCSGLNCEKTQLGDVVVSSKLRTTEFKTPVSRRIGYIIRNIADGWIAPLENPEEQEVKVHCEGDVLSIPLAASFGWRHEDIIQQYPEAIAVETEGEGLYAAAYDHKGEWMIVKGIASFGDASEQPSSDEWKSFASVMAASVAANILNDPVIFREWPHYNPTNINLRINIEAITRPVAQEREAIGNERIPSTDEILRSIASKYFATVNPSNLEEWNDFLRYLKDMRKVLFVGSSQGSLIVAVQCSSLQTLEELWEDYKTGHLNEMAQKCLVTEELLKVFGPIEIKLTTAIDKEEYRACEGFFLQQLRMVESKDEESEESRQNNFGEMEGMRKILCKDVEEETEENRGGVEDSSSREDLSLPSSMDPRQQNNGFGPLSRPRGNYATITAVVLIIISAVILSRATVAPIFFTALQILSFAFVELLRRMCLLIEELRHLQTRYDGRLRMVFTSIFTFSHGHSIFILCIVSLLIVCCGLCENYNTYYRPDYVILFILNSLLARLLLFIVGFQEPSIVDVSQINEREKQNVAYGLAWSYYFDYLRLVLPNLDEMIRKSREEFRMRLTNRKLFILVPKTCFTYAIIEQDDPRVKYAGNLEPMEINISGIRKRSYKHTLYRIEMPRADKSGEVDEYLVIMEYATPLKTLYDMSHHPEADMSRQQRDEQVMLFIRKLKEILDGCPDCRGKYELVPLSGKWIEIANVIVQIHHDARVMLDERAEAE